MLRISNINKSFKDFKINYLSLDVHKGDYFVILGKSGAGKSLLLEMIAGLVKPDSGEIFLDNNNITSERIQNRRVGLVFQDFAIFPHLSVRNNIAYPLKPKYNSNKIIDEKVVQYAKEANIEHLLDRYPEKLSGGERQRVALARTLANNPACLLLDEPLASLDVQLREDLRDLLRRINNKGITIVHVTHDYEEAIALANKVAVMNNGRIIQAGEIHQVFQNPVNEFVARFTGVKNFFKAKILEGNKARINDKIAFQISTSKTKGMAQLLIESKHIVVSREVLESSAVNNFQGSITRIISIPLGYELLVDIGVKLAVIITNESNNKYGFEEGEKVWLSFKASEIKIIC